VKICASFYDFDVLSEVPSKLCKDNIFNYRVVYQSYIKLADNTVSLNK
jgi:hypothetical protein